MGGQIFLIQQLVGSYPSGLSKVNDQMLRSFNISPDPFNDLYQLYEIIESEIPYITSYRGDTMVDIIDVEKECNSSHLVSISNEIQKTPNLIKSNMILKSIKSKPIHRCS